LINVNLVDVQKTKPETPCLALRLREAAQALGISPRLLSDWVKRGVIPCARIGGVVVFPTDTLRIWLQRQAEADRVDGEEEPEDDT
jgi:excisionase family DNA binding protein